MLSDCCCWLALLGPRAVGRTQSLAPEPGATPGAPRHDQATVTRRVTHDARNSVQQHRRFLACYQPCLGSSKGAQEAGYQPIKSGPPPNSQPTLVAVLSPTPVCCLAPWSGLTTRMPTHLLLGEPLVAQPATNASAVGRFAGATARLFRHRSPSPSGAAIGCETSQGAATYCPAPNAQPRQRRGRSASTGSLFTTRRDRVSNPTTTTTTPATTTNTTDSIPEPTPGTQDMDRSRHGQDHPVAQRTTTEPSTTSTTTGPPPPRSPARPKRQSSLPPTNRSPHRHGSPTTMDNNNHHASVAATERSTSPARRLSMFHSLSSRVQHAAHVLTPAPTNESKCPTLETTTSNDLQRVQSSGARGATGIGHSVAVALGLRGGESSFSTAPTNTGLVTSKEVPSPAAPGTDHGLHPVHALRLIPQLDFFRDRTTFFEPIQRYVEQDGEALRIGRFTDRAPWPPEPNATGTTTTATTTTSPSNPVGNQATQTENQPAASPASTSPHVSSESEGTDQGTTTTAQQPRRVKGGAIPNLNGGPDHIEPHKVAFLAKVVSRNHCQIWCTTEPSAANRQSGSAHASAHDNSTELHLTTTPEEEANSSSPAPPQADSIFPVGATQGPKVQ